MKKKVIIIGAGISGITCGVYLLDNGYDVEIYEKHYIPGGECTGWVRDNTFIDGCAHWIVGTNPKSDFYKLWKHIGSIKSDTVIHETKYFNTFDVDGEKVTIYADIDKLKEELLRVGPEDKKIINRFIKDIKAYQHVRVPVKKPIDMMNIFELTKFGFNFLPMLGSYLRLWKTSHDDYSKIFKSPILKNIFSRILENNYNVHSLAYVMQALTKKDAGVIEGGSQVFAINASEHFKELGGKLYLSKPVKKIITNGSKVTGVLLEDGSIKEADYIVASCDLHHTLYNLLENKYTPKVFEERFNDSINYPLQKCFLVSCKVMANVDSLPKMINFKLEKEISFACTNFKYISVRCHAFDKKINKGATLFTALLNASDKAYDYLKALPKDKYKEEKIRFGEEIRGAIIDYYKINPEEIKLIDVATPLTYERYCNAYKGSYMSFITTNQTKGLMQKGVIKGLDNMFLSGQWLMSPGGLPIAVFTGKHAAYRLVRKDKKKFIDLD